MNTDSGNIYPNLKELYQGEKEKGIEVNKKHLIRFGLGDRMEIRGGSFEIVEIKPYPENILVLHSLEKGIY
jgi:hypothetical protein